MRGANGARCATSSLRHDRSQRAAFVLGMHNINAICLAPFGHTPRAGKEIGGFAPRLLSGREEKGDAGVVKRFDLACLFITACLPEAAHEGLNFIPVEVM